MDKEAKKRNKAGVKAFRKALYQRGESPIRAALWGIKVASGLKEDK
ncbi:hypothetical protein KAU11_09430 [Candidatus Babeliales bacterium]|nr:hypothetical protein [Candidatus Babeliales bacterium]